MATAIVTGATGLIGSETTRFLARQGFAVVGIDNDLRAYFFGDDASTAWQRARLESELPGYTHRAVDIRDREAVNRIFAARAGDVRLVVHAAAQPSHDWAAKEPFTDFSVNAEGTLILLEATRQYAADAVFIYLSTNKVYGDAPNRLPLVETETRFELDPAHPYAERGIDETLTIDQSTHSLFGASKAAADLMVQEYGRYFGMKTGCFRGGCLTGPAHAGAELHGFLAYLMKCAATGRPYTIYGYKGKQVRDNIHAADLVDALYRFYQSPREGEVYNIGGGRFSNCSIREAVALCEEIAGRPMQTTYVDDNRIGDHVWWISDTARFEAHFPDWRRTYAVPDILREIYRHNVERWCKQEAAAGETVS